jgi:hypothetical protein
MNVVLSIDIQARRDFHSIPREEEKNETNKFVDRCILVGMGTRHGTS